LKNLGPEEKPIEFKDQQLVYSVVFGGAQNNANQKHSLFVELLGTR
jgi:hypothetical protein